MEYLLIITTEYYAVYTTVQKFWVSIYLAKMH